MIDLHIHSIYSDGSKTIEEILKICEEKKIEYISITDHNTVKQYYDEALQNKNIFSGKVIKGVELNAVFQDKNIEILGYNITPDIIKKWCKNYYSEEKLKKQQEICYKRLLNICDKQNLIYDKVPLLDIVGPYLNLTNVSMSKHCIHIIEKPYFCIAISFSLSDNLLIASKYLPCILAINIFIAFSHSNSELCIVSVIPK